MKTGMRYSYSLVCRDCGKTFTHETRFPLARGNGDGTSTPVRDGDKSECGKCEEERADEEGIPDEPEYTWEPEIDER